MESEKFLSKANTKFALALFQKLRQEENNGNIFYSPFSISAALAMVKLGTAGNTATQMAEVLCLSERAAQPEADSAQVTQTDRPYAMHSQMQTRLQMRQQIQRSSRLPGYLRKCIKPQDNDDDNVDESFAKLLGELNKSDASYALSLANRLYGEQTYTFRDEFLKETKKHYDAELEKVDFTSNAETSRTTINTWVEERTEGKITELLPSDAVTSSTRMVLVNAIYFKGKWNSQFKEEDTTDAAFRINKTEQKTVKMMRQKAEFNFRYNEEDSLKVLELPYKGNELSMIIILPNDTEDDAPLEKLLNGLTYEKLTEWTKEEEMMKVEVEVSLPRFKMEQSYDLKKNLTAMGMVDAFDVSLSNFSGMSEANDLVLSKVMHKAFVEVNEEGTEAAAATGAVVSERSAMITETFTADHPFIFFIRHNSSSSVLFAGRFCSPE